MKSICEAQSRNSLWAQNGRLASRNLTGEHFQRHTGARQENVAPGAALCRAGKPPCGPKSRHPAMLAKGIRYGVLHATRLM
jgi:hypothetical protein